jgi:CarD family transcriptional regulator
VTRKAGAGKKAKAKAKSKAKTKTSKKSARISGRTKKQGKAVQKVAVAKAGKTAQKPEPKQAKAETPEVAPAEKLPSIEEAMATLPYGEGSFVVHPKYGLGKVDRIRRKTLSTRTVPCLEIGFPYQEMKLTIPVDQVARSGLRTPIGRKEIDDVFLVLKGRATFDAKRRSAKRVIDYRKRLNVGDPTSLAESIRDLARLSLKKSLSYEERKILSTALRILSREVALARGRDADEVREEIEKIVYR